MRRQSFSVRKGMRLAVVALALAASLMPLRAAHAGVNDFTVPSFEADYYLTREEDRTSKLVVEEKIVAEFPSFDQNHGIERAIPKKYKNHPLDLKVEKVTRVDGAPWDFSTSTQNDNLVLRIGDPDTYVHGQQTYLISYSMRYVTANFSDHDEFYWDVNGDQWRQSFGKVVARLHVPGELAAELHLQAKCFTGEFGSTASDCDVTESATADAKVLTFAANRELYPYETLTMVAGFKKDTFTAYVLTPGKFMQRYGWIILAVLGPPLIAAGVVIRNWRRYGRDPRGRGIIVPEYLPPKEVSLIGSTIILKERFMPMGISATVMDLAVRHYLHIYEVKVPKKLRRDETTYEIELKRHPAELRVEEKKVVTMLFGKDAQIGARVELKDLKNKLYQEAGKLGKSVLKQLAAQKYFRIDPSSAKLPYQITGGILLVTGFIVLPFTIGFSIAGLILLLSSWAMPARTEKGVALRDYLLGLKMYMEVAEADRLKILQSPRGRLVEKIDITDKKQLVHLFEKLLPYAMLFGIEKEWAKQFADLYDQPPEWYSGSSAFSHAAFISGLQGFTGQTTNSFTAPSSSSGSGFSGGSAGGGGGGGGGGGW